MTQFNLLPDIKLEYLKAERNKRLVISFSILVTVVSAVFAIATFSWTEIQKSDISNLNRDIQHQGSLLSAQNNLNSILTMQTQIETLKNLHQNEPEVTNLATYLNQTIPVNASLNSLSIDFNEDTISMSGSADSLATVNQLVDNLKLATYTVSGVKGSNPAFSDVVLSSFGIISTTNQSGQPVQQANFSVNLNFNSNLFNNTEKVTLNVPTKVPTRSQLVQPNILFNQKSSNNNGSSG